MKLWQILGLALLAVALNTTLAQDKETEKDDMDLTKVTSAVIHTNMGDIELQFYPKDAPKTVMNFVKHAHDGYYNGVIFHRVIKGFMMQGGDPKGMGTGGTSIYGATFEDEINPESELYKTGYKRGIVAMANRGPNTNGSQFFIMHADYPLPPSYTIFAKVINGLDIVDKICNAKTGQGDRPVEEVKMEKFTLKTGE